MSRERLEDAGKLLLRLLPTGAWAAELWVFYIVTPLALALLGPGRYAWRHGTGAWD